MLSEYSLNSESGEEKETAGPATSGGRSETAMEENMLEGIEASMIQRRVPPKADLEGLQSQGERIENKVNALVRD